ncbi:hypothetical protein ACFFIX_17860 [Metabacillus herbersteinensis]|uniref:Uncharacterized protein n=1 Tax=Metabacillus herbersteinensis TaxID=283816 RepID=A0ABV6GHW3_9BACI
MRDHLVSLFIDAYDNEWEIAYILKKNRQFTSRSVKITNPLPLMERERTLKSWEMNINDIYIGGEKAAIENIKEWRNRMRIELSKSC